MNTIVFVIDYAYLNLISFFWANDCSLFNLARVKELCNVAMVEAKTISVQTLLCCFNTPKLIVFHKRFFPFLPLDR